MNSLQVRKVPRAHFNRQVKETIGIYVLVIEAHGKTQVGRLGRQRFDGIYLYVGSAMGPGGFKRIERHWAVAQGQNQSRHWHIDYLLALGELKSAFISETAGPLPQKRSFECALAQELAKRAEAGIPGFGASDCRCSTHLFKAAGDCDKIVSEAMRALGLKFEGLKFCRARARV